MPETNVRARTTPRFWPRPGPERLWLGLGLVFGGVLLAITPPFQAPDEQVHFYRAFQVADGGFVAEKRDGTSGGWIPESLPAVTAAFMPVAFHPELKTALDTLAFGFSVPLDRSMRQFIGFENTTVQTPISYLPQSLGMRLGTAFDLGPLTLLYLGRAANLIASLAIVFFAIRTAPVFKWVFALIGLMPMAVFQMASVSADAFTNAMALLFTAMILRLAVGENKADARALGVLLVASVFLCLSKLAYSALLLLFLAIPAGRLGGWQRQLAMFALLVGVNAAAVGGWIFLMQDVYVPIPWIADVDPGAQLAWILAHPAQFAGMLIDRFTGFGAGALWDLMVGRILGWLDTPMPYPVIKAYQFALIAAALLDSREDIRVGARLKLVALAALVAGLALVGTLLYLQGHPVGAGYLADVHGRYLIPLSPLPLLLLYNRTLRARVSAWLPREPWVAPSFSAALIAFLVLNSTLICVAVARRYW